MKHLIFSIFALLFVACSQQPQQKEVVEEDPIDSTDVLIPVENTLINADYHPHFYTLFMNNQYKIWDYYVGGMGAEAKCHYILKDSIPVWSSVCSSFSILRSFAIPKNSRTLSIHLRGLFNATGMWDSKTNTEGPAEKTFLQIKQLSSSQKDSINTYTIDNSEEPNGSAGFTDYKFSQSINPETESIVVEIKNDGPTYLTFERLDLLVDSVPIEKTGIDSVMRISRAKYEQFQKNVSENLAIMKEWKIIGIGESVQGSATFRENIHSIIHRAILEDNIELILLEINPASGHKINQYVTHKVDTLNLKSDIYEYTISAEWMELFDEIRAANSKRKSPIRIAGINAVVTSEETLYTYDYIGSEFLDMARKLWNPFERWAMHNKFPDSVKVDMSKKRSKEEKMWFDYIYGSTSFKKGLFNGKGKLDKTMYENVSYLLDELEPKDRVYILAKLEHLQKSDRKVGSGRLYWLGNEINKGKSYSLGYYLKKQYGKEYAVIGQFAAEGEALYLKSEASDSIQHVNEVAPLEKPFGKSVERLSSTIDKESFYVQGWEDSNWTQSIKYWRNSGIRNTAGQFELSSLSSIDAFYFTNKSIAFTLIDNTHTQ